MYRQVFTWGAVVIQLIYLRCFVSDGTVTGKLKFMLFVNFSFNHYGIDRGCMFTSDNHTATGGEVHPILNHIIHT